MIFKEIQNIYDSILECERVDGAIIHVEEWRWFAEKSKLEIYKSSIYDENTDSHIPYKLSDTEEEEVAEWVDEDYNNENPNWRDDIFDYMIDDYRDEL